MSDEKNGQSGDQPNEPSKKTFDHGLDPKPKESIKDYSARKSTEFESSSPVQFCRRYLRGEDPASLMIHALILFFVSLILAFIASNTISATLSVQSVPAFFATLASLCRVSSMMLVAWAIGRLIADAIENGAKS